jgi:Tfp pilus assembly protein PilO
MIAGEFLDSLREFDWSELRQPSACGYWPVAVCAVSCVGIILIVLLIAGLVLAPGLRESWHTVHARSAALASEYAAIKAQLLTRSASNTSMARQHAQALGVHQRLLAAESMPMVLDRLRVAAATRGIYLSMLRPQPAWQKNLQHAFEIEVQAQADWQQLTAFLDDLRTLPLAISQLDWQRSSSDARLMLFLLVGAGNGVVDQGEPAQGDSVDSGGHNGAQADGADNADWRRIAVIRRGNRYLEVQRTAEGKIRRRHGAVNVDREGNQ